MKYIHFSLLLLMLLAGQACNKSDIDDLKKRADETERRLTELEKWAETVNGHIASLQLLVTALENNDYITSITPLVENGEEIGYTITLAQNGTLTIRNGKNGSSPLVGVAWDDAAGAYYWTVDTGSGAQWMRDAAGNMIAAQGLMPQLRITNGLWEISYDNGRNWVSTGAESQGDAIFAKDGIDIQDDRVIFTLADGTELTLPLYKTTDLDFEQPGMFQPEETKQIPFKWTGTVPEMIVPAFVPEGWTVSIQPDQQTITVTAPQETEVTEDNLNTTAVLLLGDDSDRATMRRLTLHVAFTGAMENVTGSKYYENGIHTAYVWFPKLGVNDGLLIHKEYRTEFKLDLADLSIPSGTSPSCTNGEALKNGLQYITGNLYWPGMEPWIWCESLGNDWFIPTATEWEKLSYPEAEPLLEHYSFDEYTYALAVYNMTLYYSDCKMQVVNLHESSAGSGWGTRSISPKYRETFSDILCVAFRHF